MTITARGVSQYGGSGDTRLKTIYDDGTYGPDLYIVVSGESKTATVTTDASKTLAKITGNYDLENWVLLDMSVMSIVANYNVGVPLADSNVPGGIIADPATSADTVPAKIGEDGKLSVPDMSGGSGGTASGDYIPVPSTAEVGQTIVVKAVDESGKPTEWAAADMTSGGGGAEIDISRQPDLILEVSKQVVSLSISEINGEPIDTTEMVVLWEHPGGARYVPNYFRFNNEVKNSTVSDTAIANFNIPDNACPSSTTAAAILCRVKKINNGTYWYEYSGLQQNVGTITGVSPAVYGAAYRNNLIGETSIKEFYVYQASNIQEGCKVSIWVK